MAVLRKYNNKEYDFDAYTKQAIEGFDGWIDPYEVSSTKKEKVRQAMMDLLQHMTDDEGSYADLNRINFSTDYANNKGLFGKKVTNSKHYRNATAYLLKVFSGMNPYEEPKPETPTKTKASREWLGKTVLGHLGDASGYTTDEIRSKELLRALQTTQDQLKTGDYDYEDQYGNEVLNGWLNEAIKALGTTNNLDDDNTFWGRVGLTNPFYKAPITIPEGGNDPLKDLYIKYGGTNEEWKQMLPILTQLYGMSPRQYQFLKSLGSDQEQLSTLSSNMKKKDNITEPEKTTTEPEKLSSKLDFDPSYYSTTAKSFIETNIGKEHKDWDKIDWYMVKLIESQLKGVKNNSIKPTLREIEYSGEDNKKHKAFAVTSINTGKYWYAYDKDSHKMVAIEKPNNPIRRRKGGYLQILKNTQYAYNN